MGPALVRLSIALLASSCNLREARSLPPAPSKHADRGFATAHDAAVAAGGLAKWKESLERSSWQEDAEPFQGPEFGGRIWRLPDGTFAYTTAPALPVDSLARFNSDAAEHNRRHPCRPKELAAGICLPRSAPRGPRGAVEVALWHTHPGSASFGATDRALVTRLQLPLFLTRDRVLGKGIVTECLQPERADAVAK